jgi:hypothetical protein
MEETYQKQLSEHTKAVALPRRGFESGLVKIVSGVQDICEAHRKAYEAPIGDDSYMREAVEDILKAFFELLNGERGRLDGQKMCEWRREIAEKHGLNID